MLHSNMLSTPTNTPTNTLYGSIAASTKGSRPPPGGGEGGASSNTTRAVGACIGGEIGVSSRRVAPTPRQRPPCVRWAVSRPGRQLSRRTRWNLDPPRCRAVKAPPHATRTKSKANPAVRVHVGRRSPWGWAVFSCSGVGCFGAPLIC